MIQAILSAFGFLTRLPLRPQEHRALSDAAWAFPLVGVVAGAIAAGVYLAALALGVTHSISAWLAVAAAILTTGGLHEDGLADTADALAHGRDREQKLAIMQDSRIGAYGVLALILSLALRAHAIAAFDSGWETLWALVATATASRAMMVMFMHFSPQARSEGLSASAGKPGRNQTVIAAVLAIATLLFATKINLLFICLLALIALYALLARTFTKHFGGITGDTLGSVQQISETMLLITLSAGLRS